MTIRTHCMLQTRPRDFIIVLILGSLSTIGPFAIDLYLPAFSQIAFEFGTLPSRVALSLSSYFVGIAFGMIFYGPLLDRFGRKKPLFVGMSLFIVASAACAMARSIESLIVLRFLQACGGCVAQVASLTMVRDFFPQEKRVKVLSLLTLVIAVSPMLAPTIGSVIVTAAGWRWVFLALSLIVAVVGTVIAIVLPEPHQPDTSIKLTPSAIFKTFGHVLSVPQFFVYAGAGAFAFAGLFTYVAASPGIFMEHYKVTPNTYGLIFAILSVGLIGSSQLNILLLKKFTSPRIFQGAMILQFITAITLLILGPLPGFPMIALMALLFIFLGTLGTAMPNASTLALAPFSKNAGSASAMLGILQMGIGALVSTAIGIFGSGISPVVIVFAGCSTIAMTIFLVGRRKIATAQPQAAA